MVARSLALTFDFSQDAISAGLVRAMLIRSSMYCCWASGPPLDRSSRDSRFSSPRVRREVDRVIRTSMILSTIVSNHARRLIIRTLVATFGPPGCGPHQGGPFRLEEKFWVGGGRCRLGG